MQSVIVACCVLFALAVCDEIEFNQASVTQITSPVEHAEGPHWDRRTNTLYYVDIHKGGIIAYHFDTQKVNKVHLNGEVSPVLPTKADPHLLLVGLNRSVVAIEWDGYKKLGDQHVISTVSKDYPKSRFNDGKSDIKGRIWWGTMGPEANLVVEPNQGYLYKFTRDDLKKPVVALAPITLSNGLAWNKANTKFYYIDTPTLKVVEYDFDAEEGTISNTSRVVFDLRNYSDKLTGFPDGMTIDSEDNLYVALYGGGAIIKVNSTNGALMKIIPIPARDVTSAIFGGPNLEVLFVTTSKVALSAKDRLHYPAAGSVFAVTNLKAHGVPCNHADIIDSIPKKLNLLENIFPPELFTTVGPKKNSKIVARNTEIPLWQTLVNAFRSIF